MIAAASGKRQQSAPLRGVLGYPVTPLTGDGARVDEDRLRTLLDYFIDAGVHGLVVIGSTGSIGSFSEEERKRIAEVAVQHVAGKLPLYVGTGATTTAEAVRLSRHAERVGADGVQIVAMSHWPLTEDEIYGYYKDIAAAIAIPVIVHNVPALTGMDIKPDLMARLCRIENIPYAKDGNPSRTITIDLISHGRARVLYDNDLTGLQGLLAGADAWAAVITNIMPRECVKLYHLAAEKRDVTAARKLFVRMYPLLDFMARKPPVQAIHRAFELMGEPVGPPRRPLKPLDRKDTAELKRLLMAFGALGRGARSKSRGPGEAPRPPSRGMGKRRPSADGRSLPTN